jgi:uncharacterized protein (DUF885 family)
MSDALDHIAQRFFERLTELRPVEATYFGVHQQDSRLPEGGLEDAEAEIALLEAFSADLREVEQEGIEAEVGRYFVDLSLFQAQELRLWARMAEAPDQLGSGIFLLFARDFAPLEDRLESIAGRLEDAPRYLRQSRERLTEPVALWNRISLETVRQLPGLVEVVIASAPEGVLKNRLERAGRSAVEALEGYATWLEAEVLPGASQDHVIGEEHFEHLLQLRRLPDSPDAILRIGRAYLEEVEEQRQELVAANWPGRSVEEVEAQIRSDHAIDFASALDEYRSSIADARTFVSDHRLATLPPGEELQVIETPSFLRPVIPFAAYEPAAYFDKRQLGIYIVTPPSEPAQLSENNRASILNTSVHEGYPGHHLQFVCANRNPSLLRLLGGFHSTEFVEGWAHYCEQLMYEAGFSNRPEVRFVQLTDLIWRACRVVIDVELSSGRLGFEQSVDMLVGRAGMARESAEAEVKRYTYTPGYQLSYLYGKHLLLGLRERVKERRRSDFSLLDFHDRLLYAGPLPAAMWDRLFE